MGVEEEDTALGEAVLPGALAGGAGAVGDALAASDHAEAYARVGVLGLIDAAREMQVIEDRIAPARGRDEDGVGAAVDVREAALLLDATGHEEAAEAVALDDHHLARGLDLVLVGDAEEAPGGGAQIEMFGGETRLTLETT